MTSPDLKICINIAAIVCSQDGLISMSEEDHMHEILCTRFNNLARQDFDKLIEEFFDSAPMLEECCALVEDPELKTFIVGLCEKSASSDGLDIRENIALQRLLSIWRAKTDG